jgi:hypothetical protein
MLVSKKVRQHGRLITAKSRLVVATRFHKKLSSLRLHISSNTPSYSEESHEWNTLANPLRHTLSILQTWLERRLDKPTQFKARLQFRRAHQPVKPTFKQASPKEYDYNYADSKVKRKFTNLAVRFLLGKEEWHLGEDILRVHEYSRMVYQDIKWCNWVTEVSTTMRWFLMVNEASMKMHEANPLIEVWDRVQGVWDRVQGGNNQKRPTKALDDNKVV